jgi:annexin A7/11
MSGDTKNAYLALAKIAKYPPRYFAERIAKSMIGLGTREHTLIRNIILRSEIDMREIKIEFQKLYSKSLESFISGDCSGDFKKALLCIVNADK